MKAKNAPKIWIDFRTVTVCRIRKGKRGTQYLGFSILSPGDEYNQTTGEHLALHRAMGDARRPGYSGLFGWRRNTSTFSSRERIEILKAQFRRISERRARKAARQVA